MLPLVVQSAVDDLLTSVDRWLPGWIEGFYVVGSVSVGDFRIGRSDIDFVATVRGGLSPSDVARLRALHAVRWAAALVRDVGLRPRWPLVCNGMYLRPTDVTRPPAEVIPVAAQVAGRFRVGSAERFDVNPVTWYTLARYGVAVRGPDPSGLQIHCDGVERRAWTLGNLNTYWRRWAERSRHARPTRIALPGRAIAQGVLGAPRLHYTVATGGVIGKEAAARYSLDTFDLRWRELIEDSLAFWQDVPGRRRYWPRSRLREAGEFVTRVIDGANQLAPNNRFGV